MNHKIIQTAAGKDVLCFNLSYTVDHKQEQPSDQIAHYQVGFYLSTTINKNSSTQGMQITINSQFEVSMV